MRSRSTISNSQIPSEHERYHKLLQEILLSGEKQVITALQENLEAFSELVRLKRGENQSKQKAKKRKPSA